MSIIAKDTGGNFTPAPAGPQHIVCCDVVDLGMVKATFSGETKTKPMVRLVWQLGEKDEKTGKRFTISKRYTLSLHKKAALRADLESWRGRAFTAEELAGFDVERVLGIQALANVVHNDKDGKTYANVAAIMPPPKGTAKLVVEDYVRVKDRTPEEREPGSDDDVDEAPSNDAPTSTF